jgi:hypothetical protein
MACSHPQVSRAGGTLNTGAIETADYQLQFAHARSALQDGRSRNWLSLARTLRQPPQAFCDWIAGVCFNGVRRIRRH